MLLNYWDFYTVVGILERPGASCHIVACLKVCISNIYTQNILFISSSIFFSSAAWLKTLLFNIFVHVL